MKPGSTLFLSELDQLIRIHRINLDANEALALVMAWCAVQGDRLTDDEVDAVAVRVGELSEGMALVRAN